MLASELKADAFVLFVGLYLHQTNTLVHRDPTTAAMNSYTSQCKIKDDSKPSA